MCVRLLHLDEAAQAVYIGKNVRLLTRNITVTNLATPDRAGGPQYLQNQRSYGTHMITPLGTKHDTTKRARDAHA